MIDIAEHSNGNYIAMKSVAERQNISLKYMERIMPVLVAKNMVVGIQGKGGGYKLTRKPADYTVGEILRLTEGDLAPVACLECDAKICDHRKDCRTFPMWSELNNHITDYLNSVTLADLMKNEKRPVAVS
jgi:Rrf2 family protein